MTHSVLKFQSLENPGAIFPIVGNLGCRFSNRWKLRKGFFQSLETARAGEGGGHE